MSLSFERPKFDNILDLINHAIHSSGKPFKHIAADLDRSPGELRMMLSGYEGRKFPVNDLPALIESCGAEGKVIIYWLIDRYLTPEQTKVERAADAILAFSAQIPTIQKAIATLNARGKK